MKNSFISAMRCKEKFCAMHYGITRNAVLFFA